MRLPPVRKESLWSGGVCAAMLAVFVVAVYLPKTNEAAALSEQLRMQQAVVARLGVEAARTKDLEREMADVQAATGALERKLWTARETPRLLDQLDELAGRSGVTVTSIKPGVLEAIALPAAAPSTKARIGEGGPSAPSRGAGPAQASQPQGAVYQKFTVDVETKGTFSATSRFVEGLESLPRFLSLSEMRVTLPGSDVNDNPDDPTLVVIVTATAYALPDAQAAP